MAAKGKINPNFDEARNGGGEVPCGQGRFGTMTPACGIGARMVDDLDFVKARYARVKAIENRAAAREAAAERRAEREARAFAALDELLER